MNKKRSNGVNDFRTPKHDHLWFSTKFRTLNNQGRTGQIASMIHTAETIATARGCSYDVEHYMEWAPKIYNHIEVNRWDSNAWMFEPITTVKSTWTQLTRFYKIISRRNQEIFNELFIPVFWTTKMLSRTELIKEMEWLIMQHGGGVQIQNFAVDDTMEKIIVYARKRWLKEFSAGRAKIIYNKMAINREKIYGF